MSISKGKRIFCFFLTVAMLFSLIPAAFSEEEAETGDPLAKEVVEEEAVIQNTEPGEDPECAAGAPYEETIMSAEPESIPETVEEQLPEISEGASELPGEENLVPEDVSTEEEQPEAEIPTEEAPAEKLPEEQVESSENSETEGDAEDSQEAEADVGEPEEGSEEDVNPGESYEESEDTEETETQEEKPEEETEENIVLKMVTFFSSQEISLTVTGEDGEIGSVTSAEAAAYFASLTAEPEQEDKQEAEEQALQETAELPAEDTEAGEEASKESEAAELPAEEGQSELRAVYLLPAGVYTYSASAEGYIPQNGITFEVTEEVKEHSIAIELEEDQLPYGFKGMPEGYALSEEELAAKRALKEHGIAEQIARMTEGEDYAAGEVFLVADSKDYALMVAEAYSAELESYENGVAVLALTTATVTEAIKAAADMNLCLPAVEPNTVRTMSPIYGEGRERRYFLQSGGKVPALQSWEVWYNETGAENADEYLRDPTASDYQYMHDVVNTYEAWGVTKGAGVTVAVLDSGVGGHEDLPRVQAFNAPSGNAHATHVAGIIAAAEGNGIGGAGIAPEANILSYCCTNNGGTVYVAQVIAGIRTIIRDGNAWIMNCSFGGPVYSQAEYELFEKAIKDAGITVVCSMGNNGTNVMNYPAAYSIPGLIAVSSTTESGARSVFSNYGGWADVSAPGSAIMSTVPGGYDMMSGTSMAAPVVSGVCALYMSAYGYTSPAQMENIIKSATTNGVIDASKLFVKDKTAPEFVCSELSNGTVPYGCIIEIMANDNAANGAVIVYTTDGKTPAIKDGEVTIGSLYNSETGLAVTSENGFQAGKTVTVKAICVSGMGVAGKAATLKVKVDYCQAEEVSIRNAPAEGQSIVSGKTLMLQADVLPEGADQKVTWSIDAEQSSGCPGTHFDVKQPGSLITGKKDNGFVTVKVFSNSAEEIFDEVRINIHEGKPVSAISLTAGAENTPIRKYILNAECGATVNLQAKASAADGSILNGEVAFEWSSSNEAVASVTEGGTVTGYRAGKAKVICRALDGSGISATCEVIVVSLTIEGKTVIDTGSGTVYTLKSDPALKGEPVTWSISGHDAVSVDMKGKVIVPENVEPETELTLKASVNGGSAQAEVTLLAVCAQPNVMIYSNDYNFGGAGLIRDSVTDAVKQATLYSVETDYWAGEEKTWHDAQIQLSANAEYVIWASSKPAVADVENGLVKAHKAGTTTITCTNENGKKAAVTIKVINPASGVTVVSGSPATAADDYKVLGVGKSVTNKAVLGDAFGKPSVTKVKWDFEVEVYDQEGTRYPRVESNIRANKLITISSSGTVSAKSALQTYANNYNIYVYVHAHTTDNTELSGSIEYIVAPITKGITWGYWYSDITINGLAGSTVEDYFPGAGKTSATVNTGMNHELVFEIVPFGFGNRVINDFTVTSSKPTVAGGIIAFNNYGDPFLVVYTSSQTAGTAKLTVKSTDGSNKSASVTVKVSKTQVFDSEDDSGFPNVSLGTFVVPVSAGGITISRFTAPCDGEFIFTTTESANVFKDTEGYLYGGVDKEGKGTNQLAYDDNSGEDFNFKISYSLTLGQEVYIGVKYTDPSASGTVVLNITGTPKAETASVGLTGVDTSSGTLAFYKFTAPYASTFTFTTIGDEDTYGYLYDSGITELTHDDDSGFNRNFKMKYYLSEGQTVYIEVKYKVPGDISLNISGVSAGSNSVPVNADQIALRGFTAPYDGSFTFTTVGSEDTCGYLYDSDMNELANDDNSGDGNNFQINYTLSENQVVYIGVKYFNPVTSGTVTLSISGEPTIMEARIEDNSVPVYEDTLTRCCFTAPYTGSFTFTTIGSEDTYGYLYDSDMNELASDNDGGNSKNFRITYTLSADQTVYIGIMYFNSDNSGSVTLNISGEPPIADVFLGSNSVPVYKGTITKQRFTAPYTGVFTFTTTGSENTYGYLYNENKEEITHDDESGEENNFQIERNLSAGQIVYIGVKYSSISASGTVNLIIEGEKITNRALIIGNTYSGTSGITSLPGCGTDARTMSNLLESMSATPYTVTMRLDRSATEILSDISEVFSDASSSDISLFYYSGHGYSGTGHLVGNNRSELSFSALRSALDQIPGKKIVILDSCYSGQAIGKDQTIMSVEVTDDDLQAYADAAISAFSGMRMKSGELAATDYYVITACSKSQTSAELGNGTLSFGAFTLCFEYVCGWDETKDNELDHMSADQDGDGKITLNEGYTAASAELADLAARYSFTQTSKVNPENSSFVLFGK